MEHTEITNRPDLLHYLVQIQVFLNAGVLVVRAAEHALNLHSVSFTLLIIFIVFSGYSCGCCSLTVPVSNQGNNIPDIRE